MFPHKVKGGTNFIQGHNLMFFLGFPYGKKAYKVMDLSSRVIFFHKRCGFYEDVFPFHHSPGEDNTHFSIHHGALDIGSSLPSTS